jgi:hypothetical protein
MIKIDNELLKNCVDIYIRENNIRLKDVNIYIDKELTSLFINDFRITGGAVRPDFLIANSCKTLVCKYAANQTIQIDNLRNEIEKHAPYRKQTFIDVSKGNGLFIKYKIQLFAM